VDLVALRAGIREEEEVRGGEYLLFPVNQEGAAEGVTAEGPEPPIGPLADQELRNGYGRIVAVVVAGGHADCRGNAGGGTWGEEHRVETTQREAVVLGHDHEIQGEEVRERVGVYVVPLDVILVQLADLLVVAVDCDDHAYQIREKPRTRAT